VVKTDQNFIFFDREAHILDRLYIMVLFKNFHFFSKFKGVTLWFYRKRNFYGFLYKISKVGSKYKGVRLRFYTIFWNFFFQILAQNLKVLAFGFTENHRFTIKTDGNSVFLGRNPHILDRLYLLILYMRFYEF
jgi:hypothetical protein